MSVPTSTKVRKVSTGARNTVSLAKVHRTRIIQPASRRRALTAGELCDPEDAALFNAMGKATPGKSGQ